MQPSASVSRAHDEPATVEEAVMVTLARLGRRMRQRLPGEDLDLPAILLLQALLPGPLRLSSLAAALDLDASTVSRQARHLENRGLLERTSDPDDGRASQVALSAEGRTRLEHGARRRRDLVGQLLEDWSPADREQLRTLLARLVGELDQHKESV